MARKYIDCRDYPSDKKCTLALCADTDQELLDAAVAHAVQVHGYENTPELRAQVSSLIKSGNPPEQPSRQ